MISFTVCIPCVDKHIVKMEKLLESFQRYTVKPDKVIASISPKYLKFGFTRRKKKVRSKIPIFIMFSAK